MKIVNNIEFWSALCGLLGTILIFFFGIPEEIHSDGHIGLMLEQVNQAQIQQAIIYSQLSHSGLLLIFISFALQIIKIFKQN